MVRNRKINDEELIRRLSKKTPKLHCGKLRFIGSIRVLSVLPFFGAIFSASMSLPQLKEINIYNILSNQSIIWTFFGFISSLLIAYLINYIYCPVIIKKFLSLSDFYMHQITIKKCQMETYPDDDFDPSLLHVSKHYLKELSVKPCARWLSLTMLIVSIIFLFSFLVVFYLSTINNSISYGYDSNKQIIYFEFNKSELSTASRNKLDKLFGKIKNGNWIVIVKGYTDDIGSNEYNQKLSFNRARSIENYLTSHAELNNLNINVVAYGKLWPVAPNSTEEGRKLNRRVEIEIIPQKIYSN